MPPLTTPATAVLFMVVFFVVMMGIPFLILRFGHHQLPHPVGMGRRSHRPYTLILRKFFSGSSWGKFWLG